MLRPTGARSSDAWTPQYRAVYYRMLFQYIGRFVLSSTPHTLLLKTFILLALLYFIVSKYNIVFGNADKEGFEQSEPFVFKRENEVYDDFVIPAHDLVYHTSKTSDTLANHILKNTQADAENTRILDVGCGAGHLAKSFTQQNMQVVGVDQSADMIQHCKSFALPQSTWICNDVSDPMLFEPSSFTHITCVGFTLYEMSNKTDFFRNCKTWLIPHGYLVLHLVDIDKFDTVPPEAKTQMVPNPQTHSDERLTTTVVDFGDFKYKSDYDFDRAHLGKVIHTETFTDKKTQHVRQHEITWWVQPIDRILEVAQHYGFHVKGDMSVNHDPHQHVFILEKQT